MTSYTTVADATLSANQPLPQAVARALRDNPIAITEKATGAPVLANSYVVQAMIASAAVGQAQLKTATSTTSGTSANGFAVLAGGRYCFGPTVQLATGSGSDAGGGHINSLINIGNGTSGAFAASVGAPYQPGTYNTTRNSELALMEYRLDSNDIVTLTVQYVQASPPYDPFGLGDHLDFIYALVDKTTGEVKVVWRAEDPPWANNGPTPVNPIDRMRRLRTCSDPYIDPNATDADRAAYWAELAMLDQNLRIGPAEEMAKLQRLSVDPQQTPAQRDYYAACLRTAVAMSAGLLNPSMLPPITQAEKNADMDLIPHPLPHDTSQHQIVLLAGDIVEKLYMRRNYGGDDPAELLIKNWIQIEQNPIAGATKYPRDCLLVPARLK